MISMTSTDEDAPMDTAPARGGFSSLPLNVISTHVLRSDYLPEPGDLGRLRARDAYVCAAAARKGDLEELKALRADKWPWDELTCANAASGGHLEVPKWAHENGCPWDEETCSSAAKGGHLEVLKWARQNGCPWDAMTCVHAADKGYIEP